MYKLKRKRKKEQTDRQFGYGVLNKDKEGQRKDKFSTIKKL